MASTFWTGFKFFVRPYNECQIHLKCDNSEIASAVRWVMNGRRTLTMKFISFELKLLQHTRILRSLQAIAVSSARHQMRKIGQCSPSELFTFVRSHIKPCQILWHLGRVVGANVKPKLSASADSVAYRELIHSGLSHRKPSHPKARRIITFVVSLSSDGTIRKYYIFGHACPPQMYENNLPCDWIAPLATRPPESHGLK